MQYKDELKLCDSVSSLRHKVAAIGSMENWLWKRTRYEQLVDKYSEMLDDCD